MHRIYDFYASHPLKEKKKEKQRQKIGSKKQILENLDNH